MEEEVSLAARYFERWILTNPHRLSSVSSRPIYKVQWKNQPAILKLCHSGSVALKHFNGVGAVKLFQSDEGAQLIEFVDGSTLNDVVLAGRDAEATQTICDILRSLHSAPGQPDQDLPRLSELFEPLFRESISSPADPLMASAALTARQLLETEGRRIVLHGDMHHLNILRCSAEGWKAIDPKGLLGEATYDFANVFYNPEGVSDLLLQRDRILSTAQIFSANFDIDAVRVLQFAMVHGYLSACWAREDGLNPDLRLQIARKIQELIA